MSDNKKLEREWLDNSSQGLWISDHEELAASERDAEWERVVREMFPSDVQEYLDADGNCKTLDRYWIGWTNCLDEILRHMGVDHE